MHTTQLFNKSHHSYVAFLERNDVNMINKNLPYPYSVLVYKHPSAENLS